MSATVPTVMFKGSSSKVPDWPLRAEVSTLARSTVSHHLKVLHESGVLASEKIGKEVWFWINRSALESALGNVLDYLKENS